MLTQDDVRSNASADWPQVLWHSDWVRLLPVLILAYLLAFIPHWSYPYPVHVDEWVHLASSEAVMSTNDLSAPTRLLSLPDDPGIPNLEAGYHVLLGAAQRLTGLSWMTIFKYFPGLIFMMTVLAAYVLGRRLGFGWEAALMTCLIPTTVGVLGPAFMVPVAIGLLLTVLSLHLAFNCRGPGAYFSIFLMVCSLLAIHAVTAVALGAVLLPYVLLNLKGRFWHSVGVTLGAGLPFACFPWLFDVIGEAFEAVFTRQELPKHIELVEIIKGYGFLPSVFCVIGAFLLVKRGSKRGLSLVVGLVILLGLGFVYLKYNYGIPILHYRILLYAGLAMGLIGGCGLAAVRNLRLPEWLALRIKPPLVARYMGVAVWVFAIAVTLAAAIPARQNYDYYHMIDKEDYESFVWIKDNLDPRFARAMIDPWKASAFIAITQRQVYTRLHSAPNSNDRGAYQFLQGGCVNTESLRQNGLSMVYSRRGCSNPDLTQVRKYVYVLE